MEAERKQITKEEYKTWVDIWREEYDKYVDEYQKSHPFQMTTFKPFAWVLGEKTLDLLLDNDFKLDGPKDIKGKITAHELGNLWHQAEEKGYDRIDVVFDAIQHNELDYKKDKH